METSREIKHQRKQSYFQKRIAEIILSVKNVQKNPPTVTTTKLSNDNSHLFIYFSVEKEKDKTLESLNKAKGFIRSELSKDSNLRSIPKLNFKIDSSHEAGLRIEEILQEIKKSSE